MFALPLSSRQTDRPSGLYLLIKKKNNILHRVILMEGLITALSEGVFCFNFLLYLLCLCD